VTHISRIDRILLAAGLAVGVLALFSATAAAQTTDPGAPSAGSPPANQYELPVQAGRHDAAPPDSRRGGQSDSLFRSENNFGTSSAVPGDPGSSGGAGGSGANGGGGAGGAGGSAGTGSGGAGGGAEVASSENGLDTGSPSTAAAYTTLPLIIALGVLIGIAGVRMRRRAEV